MTINQVIVTEKVEDENKLAQIDYKVEAAVINEEVNTVILMTMCNGVLVWHPVVLFTMR